MYVTFYWQDWLTCRQNTTCIFKEAENVGCFCCLFGTYSSLLILERATEIICTWSRNSGNGCHQAGSSPSVKLFYKCTNEANFVAK